METKLHGIGPQTTTDTNPQTVLHSEATKSRELTAPDETPNRTVQAVRWTCARILEGLASETLLIAGQKAWPLLPFA